MDFLRRESQSFDPHKEPELPPDGVTTTHIQNQGLCFFSLGGIKVLLAYMAHGRPHSVTLIPAEICHTSRWRQTLRFLFFFLEKKKNGTNSVLRGNVEAWSRVMFQPKRNTKVFFWLARRTQVRRKKKKKKNLWREQISEGGLHEIWTFTAEQ